MKKRKNGKSLLRKWLLGTQERMGALPKTLLYVLLIAIGFVYIYPLLNMLITSLESLDDLLDPAVQWLPHKLRLDNYEKAFQTMGVAEHLVDTLELTLLPALMQTISCALAGYAFARFNFKGKRLLLLFVLLTFIVPFPVLMMPTYSLYSNYNILGSIWTIVFPAMTGQGLRAAIFILSYRAFYAQTPRALDEAARVDGASEKRVFFTIGLPLGQRGPVLRGFLPGLGAQIQLLPVVDKQQAAAGLSAVGHIIGPGRFLAQSAAHPLGRLLRGGDFAAGRLYHDVVLPVCFHLGDGAVIGLPDDHRLVRIDKAARQILPQIIPLITGHGGQQMPVRIVNIDGLIEIAVVFLIAAGNSHTQNGRFLHILQSAAAQVGPQGFQPHLHLPPIPGRRGLIIQQAKPAKVFHLVHPVVGALVIQGDRLYTPGLVHHQAPHVGQAVVVAFHNGFDIGLGLGADGIVGVTAADGLAVQLAGDGNHAFRQPASLAHQARGHGRYLVPHQGGPGVGRVQRPIILQGNLYVIAIACTALGNGGDLPAPGQIAVIAHCLQCLIR